MCLVDGFHRHVPNVQLDDGNVTRDDHDATERLGWGNTRCRM
jgi:hypothetical protein